MTLPLRAPKSIAQEALERLPPHWACTQIHRKLHNSQFKVKWVLRFIPFYSCDFDPDHFRRPISHHWRRFIKKKLDDDQRAIYALLYTVRLRRPTPSSCLIFAREMHTKWVNQARLLTSLKKYLFLNFSPYAQMCKFRVFWLLWADQNMRSLIDFARFCSDRMARPYSAAFWTFYRC